MALKNRTPIPDTDWKQVLTVKGKKYYYHPATKTSSWSIPEAIRLQVDVFESEQAARREAEESQLKRKREEEQQAAKFPVFPVIQQQQHHDDDSSAAHKKPKQDEQPSSSSFSSSSSAAAAVSGQQKAVLVEQYKDLLGELNVNAFSLWEKELPKLQSDPRYLAIPTLKERKTIFEQFCSTRHVDVAEEKRKKLKVLIFIFLLLTIVFFFLFVCLIWYRPNVTSWASSSRS